MVILSIISWFYILDFGISNSLRNKLTEAIKLNDRPLQQRLIATSYLIMLIPTVVLIGVGLCVNYFVNWAELLNATHHQFEINVMVKIAFVLFPIIFYLNTITYIYHAFFKSYIVNAIQFFNLFISSVVIFFLAPSFEGNLIIMALAYFAINILVYLIFTWDFIRKSHFNIVSIKYFDKSLIKDLLSMGIAFFLLDIASLFLLNSGPILISYFFNPEYSVVFQLPYKLLSIFLTVSTIFLSPLWTLVINYYVANDLKSIQSINKKIAVYLCGLIIIILISTLFINEGIYLWIGHNYHIKITTILLIAFIVILSIIAHTYKTLLNAISKIYIQVVFYGLSLIITLSCMKIFLIDHDGNLEAFLWSLIIGMLFSSVMLPVVYYRFLHKMKGQ
ncbi:hypothetical protein [Staphylococcus debuckii]|uniref:Polysaccharide biosynthesis protein n=1 Tax=Staphylococcus debuckii TaxID=2044912 RepID=A0ABU9EZA2_9STAP